MGHVPSPETVRAMSIVRLSRMLAVFVTLASASSRATLFSGGPSVTSMKTVLASRSNLGHKLLFYS